MFLQLQQVLFLKHFTLTPDFNELGHLGERIDREKKVLDLLAKNRVPVPVLLVQIIVLEVCLPALAKQLAFLHELVYHINQIHALRVLDAHKPGNKRFGELQRSGSLNDLRLSVRVKSLLGRVDEELR